MRLIAHRGCQVGTPENSISGLESLAAEASGIEVDVRFTSDQIPVLMHDARVDRTTDGAGLIAEMLLSEFQVLRLQGANEMPPCLEEYLYHASDHLRIDGANVGDADSATIYLDIKANKKASLDRLARMVAELPFASSVVCLTRSRVDIEVISIAGQGRVRLGLLGCNESNFSEYLSIANHHGLEVLFLQHGLDAFRENIELVQAIDSAGFQAGGSILNGTVALELARAAGCSVVLTDFPSVDRVTEEH